MKCTSCEKLEKEKQELLRVIVETVLPLEVINITRKSGDYCDELCEQIERSILIAREAIHKSLFPMECN
jgi:hypothetical protein